MKLHFKMNARSSELVSSTGLDVVHRVHRREFYYVYVSGGGAPVGVRRYQRFTAVTGYGASSLLGFDDRDWDWATLNGLGAVVSIKCGDVAWRARLQFQHLLLAGGDCRCNYISSCEIGTGSIGVLEGQGKGQCVRCSGRAGALEDLATLLQRLVLVVTCDRKDMGGVSCRIATCFLMSGIP